MEYIHEEGDIVEADVDFVNEFESLLSHLIKANQDHGRSTDYEHNIYLEASVMVRSLILGQLFGSPILSYRGDSSL